MSPAVLKHCEACTHAYDHGHWGKTLPKGAGTHCRTCHTSWPGTQVWGHCAKCHLTFRGVTAFDRHQMLTNCPILPKTLSKVFEYQEHVTTQLRHSRAALIEEGKRHLVNHWHEKLGYEYWGWNR